MIIEIISKNYNPSDGLKKVLEKKLMKLEKYFDEDTRLNLVLKEVSNKSKKAIMEAKIMLDQGRIIRAEVSGDTMYDNIDIIIPKIEGQVRKLRSSKNKKIKQSGVDELIKLQEAQNIKNVERKLARTKTVDIVSMSVKDAISELELLDYAFYAFINEDTKCVNIVYKRHDSDVGVIDLVY